MTENQGSVGPGWLHAEGDPQGTQRYWNGSAWQGEPRYVPSVPAAPKKSRTGRILLGIFLVLVLGIGGCTFAVWRFASGPIDASNDFLNAIQQEDFAGAWALSSPSCFPEGGPGQLEAIFGPNPVESYDLNSTSVTNNTGEASGRVTLAGGDERSISLVLNQVSDDWLVCGFDIGPPGS